jgi:hypothetical protein
MENLVRLLQPTASFMIKILAILALLLAACTNLSAQEGKMRRHIFSATIGFGPPGWWKEGLETFGYQPETSIPAYVKYEYRFPKAGIGMTAGILGYWMFYEGENNSSNTVEASGGRVLLTGNYYLLQKNKFDVYASAALGFYRAIFLESRVYNGPFSTVSTKGGHVRSGFDKELGLGVRYYFPSKFGVMLETGLGKSVVQIGGFVRI